MTPSKILIAGCLLVPICIASSRGEPLAKPEPREYSFSAAEDEWLLFLSEVGGASQYEYRLFGDGRLKWEHVHAATRTIYDEGEVELSQSDVAKLYRLVVTSGLVDLTRENRGRKIGVDGGIEDGTTIILQAKFDHYESSERSEPEPFTHSVVIDGAPWLMSVNPRLREVKALLDLMEVVGAAAEKGQLNLGIEGE